jgi:glycosyltransferase involved in cell wall biosynthesis
MGNPKVSILMATYNRPQFVGASIESAIGQTFVDWELIVSDDSENDGTEKAVAPYAVKDKRVRYFHRPIKGTIANSSNFALAQAKGEYVAILDDDDAWVDPQKLVKQVAFLDAHQDYMGCGGGIITMDEHGTETGRLLKPETDEAIRRVALYANPMANSTGVFRRAAGGRYDEGLLQFADWDFWLRLGTKGKLYNFPEYFLRYRMWQKASSFAYQKQNATAASVIVRRYRHSYPGFTKAIVLTGLYWCYARFPAVIRRAMNAFLSRTKKRLFSR